MAVRLRLTRVGSRKNPIWRVVAADSRSKRDGRILETVGRYNPQRQPSEIVIDRERVNHWLARGAQPSETVRKLIRAAERGAPPSAAGSEGGTATGGDRSADAGAATGAAADAGAAPTAGTEVTPDLAESEAGAVPGGPVTADEPTGDPAAAEEGASIAEAAPADEGADRDESGG